MVVIRLVIGSGKRVSQINGRQQPMGEKIPNRSVTRGRGRGVTYRRGVQHGIGMLSSTWRWADDRPAENVIIDILPHLADCKDAKCEKNGSVFHSEDRLTARKTPTSRKHLHVKNPELRVTSNSVPRHNKDVGNNRAESRGQYRESEV